MNDDLKAYIDGELPPDAADRLRTALEADAILAREAEEMRQISRCLRAMSEPEPVGQAATLAALTESRPSFLRTWSLSLAACAGVLFVAAWVSGHRDPGKWTLSRDSNEVKSAIPKSEPVEVTIPAVRRDAFIRFVHDRGGMVRPDGDVLLAFYPIESQSEMNRKFALPDDTPWPSEGLRVKFEK